MNPLSIISEAYLSRVFSFDWDFLNKKELRHLSKVVDYKRIPERVVVDSEELRDVLKWERIDKMKVIRIASRCIDRNIEVVNFIKSSKHNYKVKDLKHLLKRKPDYIKHFDIDLNKIKTKEAASLLSLGHEYYLTKINLLKYKFNFNESMSIIQAYDYERSVIEKVNYKSLKGYQVSEILRYTGKDNLDILSLEKMTSTDWFSLLLARPDMIEICDFKKFKTSDIFHSIQLLCAFDDVDLSFLILERNLDEITAFGWEKLIIKKPEIFLAHCNFEKLESINWVNILSVHPEFVTYKK